jgi:hypothetical protein
MFLKPVEGVLDDQAYKVTEVVVHLDRTRQTIEVFGGALIAFGGEREALRSAVLRYCSERAGCIDDPASNA